MRTLTAPALARAALAVCALAAAVSAQGLTVSAQGLSDARGALTSFPESQAVLYVNAHRITHEVLPRLVPKAEYDRMIAEPLKVGFDVRDIDYLAAGIRFADGAEPGTIPEFLIVLRGKFSANALLMLARVAVSSQNLQPREETYGGKPIHVFDLTSLEKKEESAADGEGQPGSEGQPPAEGSKPRPLPFKEVAAVALDANTLVVGVPGYVRAAIDAAGGQGRLSASLVELAATDPHSLWSLTAVLPENLPQYVRKIGVPPNEEADRIMGWLKQVSFSNGWDALNLTLRAAVLADSPEHANAISGLVRMGLTAAESAVQSDIRRNRRKPAEVRKARTALNAIRTFVNRTDGSTVILGASIPQRAVADFVRTELINKKKPDPPATSRRRTRRR